MSALTIILCIWTIVAMCAILFIRGATARVERPTQAPQRRAPNGSIGAR